MLYINQTFSSSESGLSNNKWCRGFKKNGWPKWLSILIVELTTYDGKTCFLIVFDMIRLQAST